MLVDIDAHYSKLANNEALTEDEIVMLLKELKHFRGACAWLADCHAASAENLPKSTSQSNRTRMRSICDTAAKVLVGDSSGIRYPSDIDNARNRCLKTVAELAAEGG